VRDEHEQDEHEQEQEQRQQQHSVPQLRECAKEVRVKRETLESPSGRDGDGRLAGWLAGVEAELNNRS
jgi:hypothetical protein